MSGTGGGGGARTFGGTTARPVVTEKQSKGVAYRSWKAPAGNKDRGRSTLSEEKKKELDQANEELENEFGFPRITEGAERLGWLVNMHPTETQEAESGIALSAVDFYFIEEDGGTFKVTVPYLPYFYLLTAESRMLDVESCLKSKFPKHIHSVCPEMKEDLDLKNHLSGLKRQYLKVSFRTIGDLLHVRSKIFPSIDKNKARRKVNDVYDRAMGGGPDMRASGAFDPNDADTLNALMDLDDDMEEEERTLLMQERENMEAFNRRDPLDFIEDIREYDVSFYIRVSIDLSIRVGYWYTCSFATGVTKLTHREDLLHRAEPRVFAFDIETTKLPLKFPDAEIDSIMMISYMVDGQGYLIINRECVSEDIEDFEFTPKPEYPGPFKIFNETDELGLIRRFFDHIKEIRPNIYVTYNGDFFDWPFVEARARFHRISMSREIGVFRHQASGEYRCRFASHMDAFKWVMRDSYLPQGSHGLKSVAKAKLGYDPLEIDPEDMVQFAMEKPQLMSSYSVSDAVATYYLYMKYVHPFIFSLCTIIPMNPDDVLRKGSGTLCEALLMVEAFRVNVIFPNKERKQVGKMYEGHLLESETYIGGHVEALESGVYRSDLPVKFKLEPAAFDELINGLDATIRFAIEVEGKACMDDVENLDEVRADIIERLCNLRDRPTRVERPQIYHLDVGAMYPNIILTNRLQPSAVVTDEECAACDFNRPESKCQKPMDWVWRGDFVPATRAEHRAIVAQLESEQFTAKAEDGDEVEVLAFEKLPKAEQHALVMKRLKEYSRKVYKKTHQVQAEKRTATVCQRENPFYVDTVRAFRDRRYEYKELLKTWKGKLSEAVSKKQAKKILDAQNMIVLYDSLQLAHKCILNSFYGYVMRRGARWFSMEMAGIVTNTGAHIIKQANTLLHRVGRPLELDTDGVWSLLPATFPENYRFKYRAGTASYNKSSGLTVSYPCVVLNKAVLDEFTNHQYQNLNKETGEYVTHAENSIFFEVDGPYKAMILPASTEEGKKLKKRYAVFTNDGTLAELKGFELKRRGELKLIKIFQSQVFEGFLAGDTLETCFAAVAKVANYWLDVLYTKGANMEDDELLALISCSSNMSKRLSEYGSQKSNAITTAKRLTEFLGAQMTRCKFIIANRPAGAPVVERALPVAIFSAEPAIRRHYLKKWLKNSTGIDLDSIRDIIDWEYYKKRLGATIQKIITIPAALQGVPNPVARVVHPSWLTKKLNESKGEQTTLNFKKLAKRKDGIVDIESLVGPSQATAPRPMATKRKTSGNPKSAANIKRKKRQREVEDEELLQTTECPSMEKDRRAWLRWMQAKWRLQRREKNERRQNEGEGNDKGDGTSQPRKKRAGALSSRGIGGYFGRQQNALLSQSWEVIQVQEVPKSPGEFRVWALVGDKLFPATVTVPHTFYLNSLKANVFDVESLENCERVEKLLPRSRPIRHLYELRFSEAQFRSQGKSIQSLLTQAEVEGVYESKMPLWFRAVLGIGAVCTVDRKALTGGSGAGGAVRFALPQIQLSSQREHGYLQGGNFKRCFLYSSSIETRAVVALYLEHLGEAHVFYVSVLPKISTPKLDQVFASHDRKTIFNVALLRSRELAYRKVQNLLTDYRQQRHGPTVVMLQSSCPDGAFSSSEWIEEHCPVLHNFPTVRIPANKKDNQYPAFGWEGFCANAICSRHKEVDGWLERWSSFCDYSQIPIGNLLHDSPVLSTDVLFSRLLQRNNHVLWVSDTNNPDVGMREEDNCKFVEELRHPERAVPGCYTTVCIQLQLRNLAINTILESHHVHDIEGIAKLSQHKAAFQQQSDVTSGRQQKGKEEETAAMADSLDDTDACLPAFRVLKNLITQWHLEVGSSPEVRNEHAEMLLDHFFRWASSSRAYLFDTALQQLIHTLMRKVFFQLLAEFKKLGSKVVHANFHQITICTTKRSREDAVNYCNFICKTIGMRPLFSHIGLQPVRFWDVLLFMDSANYGGLEVSVEGDAALADIKHASSVPVGHWNVQSHLPISVRSHFASVVEEYILRISDGAKHGLGLAKEKKGGDAGQMTKISANKRSAVIRDVLTPRLFNLIHDIQRIVAQDDEEEDDDDLDLDEEGESANSGGANESSGQEGDSSASVHSHSTPALEFVKLVCHVLGLDTAVDEEVTKLRKNLLRLISVNEFSKAAEFRNPSLSYTLANVACSFCSNVRHMDLLRDADLMEDVWRCQRCNHEVDRLAIETILVDTIQRKSLAFQVQDLICVKCGAVKVDNASLNCEICSGTFRSRTSAAEMVKSIRVFKKIATVHKMDWLLQVTEWLIAAAPQE